MRAPALLLPFALALWTGGCDASGGAPGGPGGEEVPFVVTSKSPHGGGVPISSYIELGFSEVIDVSSVDQNSLRVAEVLTDVAVVGTVTVNGLKLRLTPSGPLTPGTSYAVYLAADVRGMHGEPVGASDPWGFKTAGTPPDPPADLAATDAPRPR